VILDFVNEVNSKQKQKLIDNLWKILKK
jgi:hypothetical protein